MGKENMVTYEQAINCNKNLKEFMRITDKTSEYKFLEDNYIALDMAIQALDVWNKMFKSYEALTAKIESEDDISHATERIDKWCIEQLRGIIGDYYADRIINEKSELYSHTIKYNNDDETFEFVTSIDEMRDATPEEQEAIDKYIKSISKPTGINIFDFYEDEEQEQIDFVQPKKKIPCTIKVQANGEHTACDTCIYKVNDNQTMTDECYGCNENPYILIKSWGKKCANCKHHTDADEIHGYTPCGNCGIEQSNYEPKDKTQADGEYFCEDYSCIEIEKNCENCEYVSPSESNDNVCRNCDNKSNWKLKQAQADGEYINRQDAISEIREMAKWHTGDAFNADRVIQHLKQLPSVDIPTDSDLISRQAVYEALNQINGTAELDKAFDAVESVPSVAIPNKVGHWNHGVCDNCGYDWGKDAPIASVPNFCPNCGCPMEIER